ncbi:hypothetical protein ElyMa_005677000 [Elysia marginata]|uniref:Uncharacterized protein n=1 Tax=Elysia marginata TaxID=1093978 RepID=A0AAV4FEX5_9GAST|nr:hypothetical protein ElyMa_005677000 [Elysia marginata]
MEELTDLKTSNNNSFSGSDGLTPTFYKAFWHESNNRYHCYMKPIELGVQTPSQSSLETAFGDISHTSEDPVVTSQKAQDSQVRNLSSHKSEDPGATSQKTQESQVRKISSHKSEDPRVTTLSIEMYTDLQSSARRPGSLNAFAAGILSLGILWSGVCLGGRSPAEYKACPAESLLHPSKLGSLQS